MRTARTRVSRPVGPDLPRQRRGGCVRSRRAGACWPVRPRQRGQLSLAGVGVPREERDRLAVAAFAAAEAVEPQLPGVGVAEPASAVDSTSLFRVTSSAPAAGGRRRATTCRASAGRRRAIGVPAGALNVSSCLRAIRSTRSAQEQHVEPLHVADRVEGPVVPPQRRRRGDRRRQPLAEPLADDRRRAGRVVEAGLDRRVRLLAGPFGVHRRVAEEPHELRGRRRVAGEETHQPRRRDRLGVEVDPSLPGSSGRRRPGRY